MRLQLAMLMGFLGACEDEVQVRQPCDVHTTEVQAEKFEHVARRFAEMSGTYQIAWVTPSGGVACEEFDALRLEAEPEANLQLRHCFDQFSHPDGDSRLSAVVFAARCRLEGFDGRLCSIRLAWYTEPFLSGSTFMNFELNNSTYFSAQWSNTGEFEYGSIRATDGSLVGRVCTAPRLKAVDSPTPPSD